MENIINICKLVFANLPLMIYVCPVRIDRKGVISCPN